MLKVNVTMRCRHAQAIIATSVDSDVPEADIGTG
jgi:hypothetical protein